MQHIHTLPNETWAGSKTRPPVPGYETEYVDNFKWDNKCTETGIRNKDAIGLLTGRTELRIPEMNQRLNERNVDDIDVNFYSCDYPGLYRETIIHKDDRDGYIDPFRGLATKPYGRRMMYDKSHPQLMYGSQWSSELVDHPGTYSFPSTTGAPCEIPFKRDLGWRTESEEGHWSTEGWKNWTQVAMCPPYDGQDDQVEYSKYKSLVP